MTTKYMLLNAVKSQITSQKPTNKLLAGVPLAHRAFPGFSFHFRKLIHAMQEYK